MRRVPRARPAGLALVFAVACGGREPPVEAPIRPADDPRADFRPTPWERFSPDVDLPRRSVVFDVLCREPTERCAASCTDARDASAFAVCAVAARYREDREALELAQSLLARTGTIAGVEARPTLPAGYLGDVPVEPASPVGVDRYHLRWILSSLLELEDLFAAITRAAPGPVLFRTRAKAIRFYRTAEPSFPSAYASLTGDGSIAYNLRGILYRNRDDVAETLLLRGRQYFE